LRDVEDAGPTDVRGCSRSLFNIIAVSKIAFIATLKSSFGRCWAFVVNRWGER